MIVDDHFLSDALGIVGNASVVTNDQFDLLAGDHIAVLRDVKIGGRGDFTAYRARGAGHRCDNADLYDVLRRCTGDAQCDRRNRQTAGDEILVTH